MYCVEAGSAGLPAVRDAVFAVLRDSGIHLGPVMACTDGKTIVRHWCDQEAARKAARALTRAGLAAREKGRPRIVSACHLAREAQILASPERHRARAARQRRRIFSAGNSTAPREDWPR
jgi:hypothetical protein